MNHHPDLDRLELFAAGALPLPVALIVAAHLTFCGECRRQVEALQNLGGVLLETLPTTTVDGALFDRVLAAIDQPPAQPAVAIPPASATGVPRPLRQWIPDGYDNVRWSHPSLPLRVASLPTGDDRYRSALYRVRAGGRLLTHDHRGEEYTLVLKGSFSDEHGLYREGDFLLRQPGEIHRPCAAQNEECICLIIQDAPVRFTGPLLRLFNPLMR